MGYGWSIHGLHGYNNLIAITMLSKIAFAALKDYDRQKKQGIEPVFYADSIEGLNNIECWPTREESEKLA